jgi:acyl-coenzyme A synthetase/AMP-(fatty) acid ligase
VIISAGYRIGPFEVESAPGRAPRRGRGRRRRAPDEERGASCAPSSCLRDGHEPSAASPRSSGPRQGHDRALQVPAHRRLRRRAAQDASGKVRRAALRQ